jgi:hypothetical protein
VAAALSAIGEKALGDTKLNPIDLVDVAKAGFLILCDGGHQSARGHFFSCR